ncbi:hypothetical protein BSY15_3506 [Acidovorax sp. RAC01]|jgi:hypothetical protein|nr:hypothetical protein BSY15_3506 [Acidovorax sp. RAC01]
MNKLGFACRPRAQAGRRAVMAAVAALSLVVPCLALGQA